MNGSASPVIRLRETQDTPSLEFVCPALGTGGRRLESDRAGQRGSRPAGGVEWWTSIREEQRVRRLLLAMVACPALWAAGGASADELRGDGSSEASAGSIVVIRGTTVTVVTPAAFGPGVEVIRGAPASVQDTPRGVDEARTEESSRDRGTDDPIWYQLDDDPYPFEVGSYYLFQFHPRGARHFRHDEHRVGHKGAGRHFPPGSPRHGAGHHVRGGQRSRMGGRL
jgi:hypothetical protein